MRKLNIGCNNQDNIVQFLKGEFNIVLPYIHYKNGKVIKNFDIFLNFDGQLEDTREMQMHGIQQFGHRRMGKYEQALHFNKLGINTPATYKIALDNTGTGRFDSYYTLMEDIPNDEKFIIKAEHGARGIGQVLVNKDEMYKLVDMCNNENSTMDQIIELFDVGAKDSFKGDHEKDFLKTTIRNAQFIIQRRVELEAEWRYVYFYGQEPMIVRRSVDGTWQANTSVTGKGDNELFSLQNPDHKVMREMAAKLAEDLHAPFLSIDFYKEKNTGKIGCFEQQMQFGYAKMPKNELVQSAIQAVHAYLHAHYKNENIDK